jgi:hypothetical protein
MLLHFGFEKPTPADAEKIAGDNPFIASIRVYEIVEQ